MSQGVASYVFVKLDKGCSYDSMTSTWMVRQRIPSLKAFVIVTMPMVGMAALVEDGTGLAIHAAIETAKASANHH